MDDKTAFYVLKHYDRDQDGKLSFREFLTVILPLSNQKLRSEVTQRETYKLSPNKPLLKVIELNLSRILINEVAMYKEVEAIKQELVSEGSFNLLESFRKISGKNERFIDFDSLFSYLNNNEQLAQEDDIISIICRLDQDMDCKISYIEFINGILPVEGKY